MSLPVILRSEAEADIRDGHSQLGEPFAAQLDEVLEWIEAMPEMYGVVWQDLRAARLRRLRYVVYYVAFADRTEVLAVVHGSRDSSVWQSRV